MHMCVYIYAYVCKYICIYAPQPHGAIRTVTSSAW